MANKGSNARTDADINSIGATSSKSFTKDDIIGTGTRINLIFNELSLVVQQVTWNEDQESKFNSRTKNLEETAASKFDVTSDFEFRIKQLGISINWPEMDEKKQVSMMDVFVFL